MGTQYIPGSTQSLGANTADRGNGRHIRHEVSRRTNHNPEGRTKPTRGFSLRSEPRGMKLAEIMMGECHGHRSPGQPGAQRAPTSAGRRQANHPPTGERGLQMFSQVGGETRTALLAPMQVNAAAVSAVQPRRHSRRQRGRLGLPLRGGGILRIGNGRQHAELLVRDHKEAVAVGNVLAENRQAYRHGAFPCYARLRKDSRRGRNR